MAQHKPTRKKKIIIYKPEKYHPLNRAVKKRSIRRRIKREKEKKGKNQRKEVILILLGFLIATAAIIALYQITNA